MHEYDKEALSGVCLIGTHKHSEENGGKPCNGKAYIGIKARVRPCSCDCHKAGA